MSDRHFMKTSIKAGLALAAIAILLEPTLRRLGYLSAIEAGKTRALANKPRSISTAAANPKPRKAAIGSTGSAKEKGNGRAQRPH